MTHQAHVRPRFVMIQTPPHPLRDESPAPARSPAERHAGFSLHSITISCQSMLWASLVIHICIAAGARWNKNFSTLNQISLIFDCSSIDLGGELHVLGHIGGFRLAGRNTHRT